jgi:hypothetical protein
MLLIYIRTSSYVPLNILSIEDGTVLMSFSHLLHRNKKVDFNEQFNENPLVKQEGENLQILDVVRTQNEQEPEAPARNLGKPDCSVLSGPTAVRSVVRLRRGILSSGQVTSSQ